MSSTRITSSSGAGPRARRTLGAFAALVALGAAGSCYDPAYRWEPVAGSPVSACAPGDVRCGSTGVERCDSAGGGPVWVTVDDCAARGLVCAPPLQACASCVPGERRCDGLDVVACNPEGAGVEKVESCDADAGIACRGSGCEDLCALAQKQRSNVGCEYWAADLDNAMIDDSLNAAAQQFAVVVSNPQPDIVAHVVIEKDDGPAGATSNPIEVASASISPLGLRVFKLGPREVDGSPEGQFDRGTHTALTKAAFRVTSSAPVVAYQFNPLENANVFSNDASLLKPVEALVDLPGTLRAAYAVLGWPQTIASTEDPNTNFDPRDPIDLRAFLTIVGTRERTRVRVRVTTGVIGGGPIATTGPGGSVEATLEPFDVLNLETDDFDADFTGSIVEADQPVVVFSGSEASDAPIFETLSERRCCADHLEEQLDPIRTAGKRFVGAVSYPRSEALKAAGAVIGAAPEPEYFRVIAATEAGARVTTTLESPDSSFELEGLAAYRDITTSRDFVLESDEPVMLGNVSPSQAAAGVPRGLPGGDPSLVIVPPVEQYRPNYVFLTPDKYSFDFLRIIAPPETTLLLDGKPLDATAGCASAPGDGLSDVDRGSPTPPFVVHRCQLSFPIIDPTKETPHNLSAGQQNDGVHRLDADRRVGLLVDGFDAYVSYGYAAGTELVEIVPR